MSRFSNIHERRRIQGRKNWASVAWILLATLLFSGCQLHREENLRRFAEVASIGFPAVVKVDPVKQPGHIGYLGQLFQSAPLPSDRTQQLLRRYNLMERYFEDPDFVIGWMQDICRNNPNMDEVHALAEISLIQANWMTRIGKPKRAQNFFATAMVHAYQFLFDSNLDIQRNAYDPQFRNICDVYNQALQGLLRSLCKSEGLHDGVSYRIDDGDSIINLEIELRGRWATHEFESFQLANDFQMQGIQNTYHTFGLGVPLIAVHGQHDNSDANDTYYPKRLTLPMTAFCEVTSESEMTADDGTKQKVRRAILRLYDPLEQTNAIVNHRSVPLESDITTPLAYNLNDPLINTGVLATISLLNANLTRDIYGVFMLEPYDPNKIPVVLVHGLWSSPVTWLEMFNDLRANRELRSNYQFWFYSYPTGQPFWISARQMREDLEAVRQDLDPYHESESLDEMVLVGHSMGGLVSRLQTTQSNSDFWKLVSKSGIDEWEGDPDALEALKKTFFFEPNPQVKRVITLATPNQGSSMANLFTKWASQKLFTLPDVITTDFKELARKNSSKIENRELLTVNTSIDSLSPESGFIKVMNSLPPGPSVHFHNIVGNVPRESLLQKTGAISASPGDGVVSLESARALDAESEIEVESEHQSVHQHPRSILEVRRILLEHLVEMNRIADPQELVIPTGFGESHSAKPNVQHASGVPD